MEKKTMGTLLAALRRAQGLTQQEIADRLSVSNRAVSRWERDEAAPDISLLPAIADLYGITVDELLRGERRRTPDETTPAHPEAAPASDAPPHAPPPDPRALRGMRALCRRARSRFGTLLLISVALVAAGYVAMLGIVYGLERVYIGFAVFCLSCVGSAVLSVLAITLLRDVLGEQAPDTADCRLPDADLAELVRIYGRGCFAGIASPAVGMILSLPLVLYKKGTYFGQAFMMDFKDYLLVALLLAGASAFAGWLSYRPFQATVQGKWAAVLEIPAPTGYAPARKTVLRRLNLCQGISAVAGLCGGLLLDMLIMSVTTPANDKGWPFIIARTGVVGILLPAGVLLPVVFLIRAYRRLAKDDRAARRHVLLTGARNVLAALVANVFWGTGITYISSGEGDTFSPTCNWTPQFIAVWACVTLSLFAITELLRRRIDRFDRT